jgi:hypothetical protein
VSILLRPSLSLLCWLLLGAWLVGSARAEASAPLGHDDSPGLVHLSDGDRAWFAGDRPAAVEAWRSAVDSGEPAAEAMARLRLLHFTGNWGMAVHGPRIDRALAACPEDEPWCRLALVDFDLLAPPEVGAEQQRALAEARALEAELEGPALARRLLVERDAAALERLATLPRDGFGDGLVLSGGDAPAYPGTWLLGLGLLGGPGIGFGGGLHFVHPDLFLRQHRLALEAGGTTRGSAWLAVAGASAGTVYGQGDLGLSRWIQDLWVDDAPVVWRVEGAQAALGPGLRLDHLRLELGARVRWDRVDGEALAGHGPELGFALDHRSGWGANRRGWSVGSDWRSALQALGSDYDHLYGRVDARGYLGGPWDTVVGLRMMGARVFVAGVPWYLEPTAGGADILRGAPAGRYRGPSLAAADLEWRRMITGPLEGAVFGCGAWVEGSGWHPGGGVGLRLLMPPRQLNVVRLDLAVSDAGWAVTTGWGETF